MHQKAKAYPRRTVYESVFGGKGTPSRYKTLMDNGTLRSSAVSKGGRPLFLIEDLELAAKYLKVELVTPLRFGTNQWTPREDSARQTPLESERAAKANPVSSASPANASPDSVATQNSVAASPQRPLPVHKPNRGRLPASSKPAIIDRLNQLVQMYESTGELDHRLWPSPPELDLVWADLDEPIRLRYLLLLSDDSICRLKWTANVLEANRVYAERLLEVLSPAIEFAEEMQLKYLEEFGVEAPFTTKSLLARVIEESRRDQESRRHPSNR